MQLVENNLLGDEAAKAIAKGLSKNKCLKILDLEGNEVGNSGARSIVEALEENNSLEKLYLGKWE